jgi:hypothetical protein
MARWRGPPKRPRPGRSALTQCAGSQLRAPGPWNEQQSPPEGLAPDEILAVIAATSTERYRLLLCPLGDSRTQPNSLGPPRRSTRPTRVFHYELRIPDGETGTECQPPSSILEADLAT